MESSQTVHVVHSTKPNNNFLELVETFDAELAILNGELESAYAQFNTLVGIQDFFVAYDGHVAVGCAAMKPYREGIYEVKRVFVKKEYRKRGAAKLLMTSLEERARSLGVICLILETGKTFIPAHNLYKSLGYSFMDNYDQYRDMPDSVCMRKYLA